jgi:hypothetical protein
VIRTRPTGSHLPGIISGQRYLRVFPLDILENGIEKRVIKCIFISDSFSDLHFSHLEGVSSIVATISILLILQLVTTSNSNSKNKFRDPKTKYHASVVSKTSRFERVQPIWKTGSRPRAEASENIAAHGPFRVLHCIAPSHTGRLEHSNRPTKRKLTPGPPCFIVPLISPRKYCP